jgi:hypothetical protein
VLSDDCRSVTGTQNKQNTDCLSVFVDVGAHRANPETPHPF